jgi:hypothetical protein
MSILAKRWHKAAMLQFAFRHSCAEGGDTAWEINPYPAAPNGTKARSLSPDLVQKFGLVSI